MRDSSAVNRAALVAGALFYLLAAGCAGVGRTQPPPQPATQAVPVTDAAPAPPTPVEPVRPAAPATGSRPPAPNIAGSTRPSALAKPPAAVSAPPTSTLPVPKTPTAPVASEPSVALLDLASLETRLRESKAIGVLTKISLKNQVDDLLDKFRAYYRRQSRTTLAELRRPYDMLLLKVLSLLQDSDPSLARDIFASREALWGILADPQKFTEANLMAGETP